MRRTLILVAVLLPYLMHAQPPVKKKKYPSLLWEITGNGLKKPSYLFGTMHVSSKIAFHLADSFYLGIRNADIVALETNPESWQEDMSKYEFESEYGRSYYRSGDFYPEPDDYLNINTLKFYKYDKKIERSLYSNPSTINNLLYRTYGNESSDFEEDTYLDMYIYQCGKKWGKKVAGVERYGESMKLMAEAYKDAAKDRNTKDRSYDPDEGYSSGNLQEAYRTGNLDWLDSINKYNSFSAAFDEKFMYKRNEIQAKSIDSIIRSGLSLFVGVGAAHLPGQRGVIEMLREMGYKLRPIKMGERDSQHKNQVEKLRVPVAFSTQTADDAMYKVDIPGKFYKFGDDISLEQRQYADMANGSYYMVTRIMTNAWMWGHNTDKVKKAIDSLLYENIPGKILNSTPITKNGYSGMDITNRTRRGDVQRYNIFITPFEIIVFKMSGTGDYVKIGEEAKKFFGSIHLKEFTSIPAAGQTTTVNWKKYSPAYGGFAINMPHDPFIGNDGSWLYDAEDRTTNTQYRVVRTDIHNYDFVEEDTFDLGLMDESFSSSEFIEKQISRKHTTHKGYPALDVEYKDKSGGVFLARYIIQGPHYYTLVARGKKESQQMKDFLNSFEIKPFIYKQVKEQRDTTLYYTVKTPVPIYPEADKEKLDIPRSSAWGYAGDEEENESEMESLLGGVFRSKVVANDTTGEKLYVSFHKTHRYFYIDSVIASKYNKLFYLGGDTSWIIRSKKEYELPNKVKVWDVVVSDTGSSRSLRTKYIYKDGIYHSVTVEMDTLTPPSDFVRNFFESFAPADTLKSINPYTKKISAFIDDFMSTDTTTHKRAVSSIGIVTFDSTDLPVIKKMVQSLNWNEKKYLDTKKAVISKLYRIRTKESSDYLKQLFYAAGDTVDLQYHILETLLQQKTSYAYNLFRDIIISEPPVLNASSNKGWDYSASSFNYLRSTISVDYGEDDFTYSDGGFVDELYDSLKLTRTIFPDLLPLINLDDYEPIIMRLLSKMVDSNLIKAKDYEMYYSKFFLEAKQEMKKQAISEKNKSIEKAVKEKEKEGKGGIMGILPYGYDEEEKDYGNDRLALYATLLIPFSDTKPAVLPLIEQMLASSDKRLKYRTMMLLINSDKRYPDTMLNYFAGLDEYRYELYDDLKELKKLNKFPDKYNNHIDLAKSMLLNMKSYDKPDSVVYIDRLSATVKDKKGYVYFFRYKTKKDDPIWKIASAGLIPEDPKKFEFEEKESDRIWSSFDLTDISSYDYMSRYARSGGDFTEFTDIKIKDEIELPDQLKKQLRKQLYSLRKSAREFYSRENDSFDVSEDFTE